MIALSVSIEGATGLTWPRWKEWVVAAERWGLAGLFVSDHLVGPFPPDHPSLDPLAALVYAADRSERVHIGTMVSPLSIRDPVMLVRQALALDDLSGGRMVLGVGAGWNQREHDMFGYDLGDVRTRMDRFAEGVAVIAGLLRSDAPVSHEGQFFHLHDAVLLPRPQRSGGPPLMIGGSGPKRTARLVAKYADAWNAQHLAPDELRERNAALDALIREEGRSPGDVKRTLTMPILLRESEEELAERVRRIPIAPLIGGGAVEAVVGFMRGQLGGFVGTTEEVVARIGAYAAAGLDELVVQWFGVDDLDGMAMIAERVLPRLSAPAGR